MAPHGGAPLHCPPPRLCAWAGRVSTGLCWSAMPGRAAVAGAALALYTVGAKDGDLKRAVYSGQGATTNIAEDFGAAI